MGKSAVLKQGIHTPFEEGLIHVWSARYSDLIPDKTFLSALASPEEILKAAGYKKPGDSQRYILRHGMVRAVLGPYLHKDPEEIQFVQGINGKPDLDPDGPFTDIRFSLSRTDEMVCLGIIRNSEIGLDIVRTQPRFSFSAIGRYLFTPGERWWIAQAVPDQRPIRFFRIWSLKEALLKATGGNVRMMKEADMSGIMTNTFLDGFYTVNTGETDQRCYIHESGCGVGHHCALITIPKITGQLMQLTGFRASGYPAV